MSSWGRVKPVISERSLRRRKLRHGQAASGHMRDLSARSAIAGCLSPSRETPELNATRSNRMQEARGGYKNLRRKLRCADFP